MLYSQFYRLRMCVCVCVLASNCTLHIVSDISTLRHVTVYSMTLCIEYDINCYVIRYDASRNSDSMTSCIAYDINCYVICYDASRDCVQYDVMYSV